MKQPRPYQVECLRAVRRQFDQYASTVAVLPTGGGKTSVAAWLMNGCPAIDLPAWDGNCLFVAHTTELIDQAAGRLAEELGYMPIVEMGVRGADPAMLYQGSLTVVGSVQSMCTDRRLEKYDRFPFSLVVFDECHRATAAGYVKVLARLRDRNPNLKALGITATPNRADGTALGTVFESVAYQLSIRQMIDDGWLVPIRQEYVVVEDLDFTGLKSRRNDFGEADFSDAQIEQVIQEEETLHKMGKPVVDKVGDRRTLVFMPGVQSAHAMAAVINRYKPGSAAAVDGTTPKDVRKATVGAFSDGRLQFLCNALLFTEGFDAPVCSALAMCRPTRSVGRYTQMLGRGLRALPGVVDGCVSAFDRRMEILRSAKPDVLVLDFVGNSNHKLADAFDVLGGNYDAETKELARRAAVGGRDEPDPDVAEKMELAHALAALKGQWKEREHIRASRVRFNSWEVDPFGDGAGPAVHDGEAPTRGTASDAQVGFLVKLGVHVETARRYSKRQAGAVIDSLAATRCTTGQANALRRLGLDPAGFNVAQASAKLDELKGGRR